MKQQAESSQGIAKATVWLVLFQILGLLIPILTLPILARGLGVTVFGQVMLAQAVVFLGVLFVDAGFNTESQRRVSIAANDLEAQQALVDNFIARGLCSMPVLALLLIIGYVVPDLPFRLVAISLPLVLGTLLFPQWWYVAQQQGIKSVTQCCCDCVVGALTHGCNGCRICRM
jgi:O-antigen/teichoic acid export membrane protein